MIIVAIWLIGGFWVSISALFYFAYYHENYADGAAPLVLVLLLLPMIIILLIYRLMKWLMFGR